MNDYLLKIINPVAKIENGSIDFNLNFFKVIFAILIWFGTDTYIKSIDLHLKNNYVLKSICYIIVIPVFVWLYIWFLGIKRTTEVKKKLSFKIISISLLSVVLIKLLGVFVILRVFNNIPENQVVKNVLALMNSNIIYSIIVTCLYAPIIEEVFFRGILFKGICNRYNSKSAIIISSLIFGLAHMNLVQGTYAFLLGIILANIYNKTKSIYLVILCHSISNLMSFINM